MTDEQAVQEGAEQAPVESTAEVQTEEFVEEQLPEEPLDHGERSQMGRKLAEEIKARQAVEDRLQSLEQSIASQPPPAPYTDPYADSTYGQPQQTASPQRRDPDEPITWGDIERHQQEQVQKQQMYESAYTKAAAHFTSDLSQEDYEAVRDLAFSPEIQNRVKSSGHPVIDAERHFDKARLMFEQKKTARLSKPQIRSQEAPPRNLGGSSTTPADNRQPTAKLSPEAEYDPYVNYLRNEGKTDEEIAKMMKGDV